MKPKSIVTDLVQSLYHALNVELSDKILETRDLKEFQKLSKEDIQIKWMTLSGSTEPKENDQLGLANVKILKDGSVVNEKVISFVGKGVKAITDVIG